MIFMRRNIIAQTDQNKGYRNAMNIRQGDIRKGYAGVYRQTGG
jgi:hypothetical protein